MNCVPHEIEIGGKQRHGADFAYLKLKGILTVRWTFSSTGLLKVKKGKMFSAFNGKKMKEVFKKIKKHSQTIWVTLV